MIRFDITVTPQLKILTNQIESIWMKTKDCVHTYGMQHSFYKLFFIPYIFKNINWGFNFSWKWYNIFFFSTFCMMLCLCLYIKRERNNAMMKNDDGLGLLKWWQRCGRIFLKVDFLFSFMVWLIYELESREKVMFLSSWIKILYDSKYSWYYLYIDRIYNLRVCWILFQAICIWPWNRYYLLIAVNWL